MRHLNFRDAQFLTSAQTLAHVPPDRGAEVAFAGRSNAGKSSAINTITDHKGLARTSKTPGRTQLLNFFTLAEGARLVDLPGYGYARVPAAVKAEWEETMSQYLRSRRSLRGLCLIMDIRHPLTPLDQRLCAWATSGGLPLHILLTKADKLSRGGARGVLQQVQRALREQAVVASVQLFSAVSGEGRDEAQTHLRGWLQQADERPKEE